MLSRGFIRTLAACAATLALTASAPAFAGQGSTRSAVRPTGAPHVSPHTVAPPSLRHITAFNGATLDPNGTVDPNSGVNPTDSATLSAVRLAPQPDGVGIAIDPNG
ncbi:MAG TPA: hypothetical protein VGE98_01855 [Thermoanaerobaculia bacterium]